MTDLDMTELSAFLDGELDPERAREIEVMISSDPDVRSALDELRLADQQLRSIAVAAAFRPALSWPEPIAHRSGEWLALPLLVIFLAWAAGKLAPGMTPALVVNAASFLVFIACLTPLVLREARAAGAVAP